MLALLAGVGAWELYRLSRASGTPAIEAIGIPLAALMPLGAHAVRHRLARRAAGGGRRRVRRPDGRRALVPVPGRAAVRHHRRDRVRRAVHRARRSRTRYALRHHRFVVEPAAGAVLLFFPIALTWVSDTGAYFAGRAFGKRKLMPDREPGKDGRWRGRRRRWRPWPARGCTTTCVLRPVAQLALAPWTALVFGAVVSGAGQVGDLVESLFKREAGVKDSSSFFGAHGGVLDRLDSLYFVLPVAYLILSRLLLAAPR